MNGLNKTWLQYEAGKDHKRKIGLYSTIRENERFYRGDQWYGVPSDGLPRPVFNIVRRVVDYLTCSVAPSKVRIRYSDEHLPYFGDTETCTRSMRASHLLSANARYRWERSGMDAKIYQIARDAAVTGDGILYCYWDPGESGDGRYTGDIATDVIDSSDIFVADPNRHDIQSQDYIILSGRASVLSLRREARECGACEADVLRIVSDSASPECTSDKGALELEGEDEEKATYLIKFWREDGRVCFEKSTRTCVISRVSTPLSLYPIAYFNWFPTKGCFHGTSAVSGMIANQKYVNRAYAMVMKHMSDTAFSKVVYDKSRIPEWSNEVGEAIAAMGGTNVSDAVAVLGVGKLQDKYLDFLANVISVTKELGGATETALGNVTPNNTSAILAVQEASRIPLKLVRSALYQCIEDLASIWADMALAYYADDRLIPMTFACGTQGSRAIDREGLGEMRMRAYIDVVDSSAYGSSVTISILDKLLDGGHITAEQYLSRIPEEYIENAAGLIRRSKNE